MADMADYANEGQAQSLEDLLDYETGSIDIHEAHERGVVNETGCTPNVTVWGVHDAASLLNELDLCELDLLRAGRRKSHPQIAQKWQSGGKSYSPNEMTTQHLVNAIAYAERNGMDEPLIQEMKNELKGR